MDRELRILILEHIPEDAERIQHALEKSGINFKSRLVKTKTEYLDYLEKALDVIIVDYDLPNRSAIRALQILNEHNQAVPLIFIASAANEDQAEHCIELGAADFILKNKLAHLGPAVIHALEDKTPPPPVQKDEVKAEFTNAHLRLQKIFEDTIHALASVTESRDPFTDGHQKRVASLSYGIAYSIFLKSHESAEALYLAGLVHDIGKIAVPIEILSKPTEVTDLEMNIIKTHPQVGYNILKNIDFPWPIAQMVLQHHERLDGSGYPKGLKGRDIMMEARILGVADIIEAICYPRSYRSALTIEQAMEELTKKKEILYDPAVVDVCMWLFKKTEFSFVRTLELCDSLRDSNI
ncbi:MAG: HD domain-containing phosphohydrolase [Dehalococcoidia bacterium]|jgi:HD-GYP domain-containing protein (c-di-GMP phosphodiesterase class II)